MIIMKSFKKPSILLTISTLAISLSHNTAFGGATPEVRGKAVDNFAIEAKRIEIEQKRTQEEARRKRELEQAGKSVESTGNNSHLQKSGTGAAVKNISDAVGGELTTVAVPAQNDAAFTFNSESPINKAYLQDKNTVLTKEAMRSATKLVDTLSLKVAEESEGKISKDDPSHAGMSALKTLIAEIIQTRLNKGEKITPETEKAAADEATRTFLESKIYGVDANGRPLTLEQAARKLADESNGKLTVAQAKEKLENEMKKEKEKFCECTKACVI